MSKATLIGTEQRQWCIEKLSSKKWRLALWCKRNDGQFLPDEYAVVFDAQTKEEAEAKACRYIAFCEKESIPQEKTVFSNVPTAKQERWIDAWIKAHKNDWPNLFKVPKGSPSDDAIAADLIARGFTEEASLKIATLAAKTNFTPADKLNVWLVTNWFHGEMLSEMQPKARALCGKKNGFSVSEKSLGMKLTRLGLTARTGCQ